VTLGGRYCIDRRVGEGGMAHVYFARELERDSEVAVKVLLPQLASDPASVDRLRREAVIAARLEHENVCPITDMGETPEGHLYLVMPFLPGEPRAIRGPAPRPLAAGRQSVDAGHRSVSALIRVSSWGRRWAHFHEAVPRTAHRHGG
jgi:serine/threonine-protein kinase